MAISGERFRAVLGRVPTAVAVIAGRDDAGRPVGFSCGSFFSVSLDPPLVGFCVAATSTSWPRFSAETFCVNVLGVEQLTLARRFANRAADKFDGVDWQAGPLGSPHLTKALAWIDCTVSEQHQAGDHTIVLGTVANLVLNPSSPEPLIFHGGDFGTVAASAPFGLSAS